MYSYKVMNEDDIAAVLPLYLEQYNEREGGCWTNETAARCIRQSVTMQDAYCLLMLLDGAPVGFVRGALVQYDDLVAYDLKEIVIAPAHQNKGLGTRLIREVETRVKALGAKMMQLDSVKDEQHEHFYRKLGFGTTGNFVGKSKFFED